MNCIKNFSFIFLNYDNIEFIIIKMYSEFINLKFDNFIFFYLQIIRINIKNSFNRLPTKNLSTKNSRLTTAVSFKIKK